VATAMRRNWRRNVAFVMQDFNPHQQRRRTAHTYQDL
jgi:hypothetical protein